MHLCRTHLLARRILIKVYPLLHSAGEARYKRVRALCVCNGQYNVTLINGSQRARFSMLLRTVILPAGRPHGSPRAFANGRLFINVLADNPGVLLLGWRVRCALQHSRGMRFDGCCVVKRERNDRLMLKPRCLRTYYTKLQRV